MLSVHNESLRQKFVDQKLLVRCKLLFRGKWNPKQKLLERCSFCDGLSENSPLESLPGVNLRDEGILRLVGPAILHFSLSNTLTFPANQSSISLSGSILLSRKENESSEGGAKSSILYCLNFMRQKFMLWLVQHGTC
jgi:hypothetical protein